VVLARVLGAAVRDRARIRSPGKIPAPRRRSEDKVFIGGAEILAVPTDAGVGAGADPVLSCFDELWDYRTEAAHRFFDEMVPPPTRKKAARLTVTYAGYTGESVLLESLYNRGMGQPEVAPSLRAGDGILMFWTHEPIAPWQDDAWVEQMRRQLRPLQFARMIRNEWVSSESSFVDMADFDLCIDPDQRQELVNKGLPIWVGFDGSVSRDWTAVVAVTIDRKTGRLRLVWHKLFKPTAQRNIDFEDVFDFIRQMSKNFSIQQVAYDPHQLASISQRLTSCGVPMEKLNQTSSNLTAIGSVLYEAIKVHSISFYEDGDLRRSMSRAIAVESGSSGWKITKSKASHKVDFVVALAMACHAATQALAKPQGLTSEMILRGLAEVGVQPVGGGNVGNPRQYGPQGQLGERALLQMQRGIGFGGGGVEWSDIGSGGRMRR